MKRLIINADDLGLCAGVNQGIAQAYRNGILTSASLLANCPGFDHGVAVARANPDLGVGVHLNVIRGRPVAPPESVAPLLNEAGCFGLDFHELGRRCREPEVLAAAETEYRAQIEKVLAAGVQPTHLDAEKHHAVWGRLRLLLIKLAKAYGIPGVRNLQEPVWFVLRRLPWPGMLATGRALMLRLYATLADRSTDQPRPDRFFGQAHIGSMTAPVWLALLAHLPDGLSEVMVHPGLLDAAELEALAAEIGPSWIHPRRPVELAALCDAGVKAALEQHGIQTVTYAVLGVGGRDQDQGTGTLRTKEPGP